jgi:hypothetical protein
MMLRTLEAIKVELRKRRIKVRNPASVTVRRERGDN